VRGRESGYVRLMRLNRGACMDGSTRSNPTSSSLSFLLL